MGKKLWRQLDLSSSVSESYDTHEALQRWNEPRINMWRVFATYFSFFVFGMNDGAYGVRLASAERAHSN